MYHLNKNEILTPIINSIKLSINLILPIIKSPIISNCKKLYKYTNYTNIIYRIFKNICKKKIYVKKYL